MKFIFATLAIPALIAASTIQVHASGDLGCETVDKGGYFNLVDPNCIQSVGGTALSGMEDKDDRIVPEENEIDS